jgi:hypothetical protein
MTLAEIKQEIWNHPKVNRNVIDLQIHADAALVRLPINTVENAQKLLEHLNKKKKPKPLVVVRIDHIIRYVKAHEAWFKSTYPSAYRDGHYPGMEPTIPDTATANGLQSFITNYITWTGGRCTRVNVQGRKVAGKFIKSSTRKGSSDLSSTIRGRSCMWEIKVGADKPRPNQLKEQERERRAGGEYFFIHNVAEFFECYDKFVSSIPVQATLL